MTNPAGILSGKGVLCGPGFYHAYHTPEIAAFQNPVGAWFDNPRFWLAEVRGEVKTDHGILKLGSTELQTLYELPPIVPTMLQRTAYAILMAGATLNAIDLNIPEWQTWADDWLTPGSAARTSWGAEEAASAVGLTVPRTGLGGTVETAAWVAEIAAWVAVWAAKGTAESTAPAAGSAKAAENVAKTVDSAADIICDAAALALAQTWEE